MKPLSPAPTFRNGHPLAEEDLYRLQSFLISYGAITNVGGFLPPQNKTPPVVFAEKDGMLSVSNLRLANNSGALFLDSVSIPRREGWLVLSCDIRNDSNYEGPEEGYRLDARWERTRPDDLGPKEVLLLQATPDSCHVHPRASTLNALQILLDELSVWRNAAEKLFNLLVSLYAQEHAPAFFALLDRLADLLQNPELDELPASWFVRDCRAALRHGHRFLFDSGGFKFPYSKSCFADADGLVAQAEERLERYARWETPVSTTDDLLMLLKNSGQFFDGVADLVAGEGVELVVEQELPYTPHSKLLRYRVPVAGELTITRHDAVMAGAVQGFRSSGMTDLETLKFPDGRNAKLVVDAGSIEIESPNDMGGMLVVLQPRRSPAPENVDLNPKTIPDVVRAVDNDGARESPTRKTKGTSMKGKPKKAPGAKKSSTKAKKKTAITKKKTAEKKTKRTKKQS